MSIIPEGTTHEYSQPTTARWRNLSGETWSWWGGRGWIPTTEDSLQFAERNADRLTPVSAEWDGEGLPPVGAACEVLWSSTTNDYVCCLVLAHDEGRAVYRFTSGSRKGEYGADDTSDPFDVPTFRPIRTPEQIAADSHKERCMQKLNAMWDADTRREEFLSAVYAMILEEKP